MPIEQAQYIDTLTPEWPLGTDPQKDGDDHIRMVKQVLQNTFPNIDAAVMGTPTQLNNLTGGISLVAASEETPSYWRLATVDGAATEKLIIENTTLADVQGRADFVLNYASIASLLYPVGTIHISASSANPSTYLGFGTWVQRSGYLAGVGSMADAAGMAKTYGAGDRHAEGRYRVLADHIVAASLPVTLTMDAVPDHQHDIPLEGSDNGGNAAITSSADDNVTTKIKTVAAGGHTPTGTGSATIGAGDTLNGAQYVMPYWGYYIWERTA